VARVLPGCFLCGGVSSQNISSHTCFISPHTWCERNGTDNTKLFSNMANEHPLSMSKYAKTLNISEGAIRKAIKTGKIINGYDRTIKKIIPSIANQEYGFLHMGIVKPYPGQNKEKVYERNVQLEVVENQQLILRWMAAINLKLDSINLELSFLSVPGVKENDSVSENAG
ncbi:MAG: hypothetical protein ABIN01_04165, partial [Ferruginibacter sp.]